MKSSYTTTPRTMRDCTWASWGDPIERPNRAERGADVALAVVIGVLLAAALVAWWAS